MKIYRSYNLVLCFQYIIVAQYHFLECDLLGLLTAYNIEAGILCVHFKLYGIH